MSGHAARETAARRIATPTAEAWATAPVRVAARGAVGTVRRPHGVARGLVAEAALALAGLCAASVLAFLVLKAMPADPAVLVLVDRNVAPTPEAVAALRAAWGLDRSLPEQYLAWLGRFLAGDWGVSFRTDRPVLLEFAERLPVSAAIGLGGLTLATAAGALLGFAAACAPGGGADRASRAMAVAGQSVPAFWTALLMVQVMGIELGAVRPFLGGALERLVLPTLLVALYSVGSFARVVRRELLAAAETPWFRTALAKGLSRRGALARHGMRHAAVGMLAAVTPECGWAIGGTAVAEVVFAVPGISAYVVESVAARDYFALQGYVVAVAAWMTAVHLCAAALRRRLDPRIGR
jgi:peptide/nickel transport system permease protein